MDGWRYRQAYAPSLWYGSLQLFFVVSLPISVRIDIQVPNQENPTILIHKAHPVLEPGS